MSNTDLPVIRPLPESAPRSRPDSQVCGQGWRVSVLTPGLLRVEYAPDGQFEDRASTFAIRRELPKVQFSVERTGNWVTITTERVRLRYDGAQFGAAGLMAEVLGADAGRWRYGDPRRDLGGTARTLDDVDGRTELEPGWSRGRASR